MQSSDVLSHVRPRRMSRAEYERLAEQGCFRNEHVELVRGIVVEMPPIGAPHCDTVSVLNRLLVIGVGDRAVVRIQLPFAASDDSEPQPDVLLAPPRRYADRHPDVALLIIEVAETSLAYDRETKALLYAESGVPEYWVVDVNARELEVFDLPSGGRYARARRFGAGASVAASAFPDVRLEVGELFA
jgi:Uma2 family endonuclease